MTSDVETSNSCICTTAATQQRQDRHEECENENNKDFLFQVGRCRRCLKMDNDSRVRQDYSHYRYMLKTLRRTEQGYGDGSKIAFLLQVLHSVYIPATVERKASSFRQFVCMFSYCWIHRTSMLVKCRETRKICRLSSACQKMRISVCRRRVTYGTWWRMCGAAPQP